MAESNNVVSQENSLFDDFNKFKKTVSITTSEVKNDNVHVNFCVGCIDSQIVRSKIEHLSNIDEI